MNCCRLYYWRSLYRGGQLQVWRMFISSLRTVSYMINRDQMTTFMPIYSGMHKYVSLCLSPLDDTAYCPGAADQLPFMIAANWDIQRRGSGIMVEIMTRYKHNQ
jgi:hypothetical protein